MLLKKRDFIRKKDLPQGKRRYRMILGESHLELFEGRIADEKFFQGI